MYVYSTVFTDDLTFTFSKYTALKTVKPPYSAMFFYCGAVLSVAVHRNTVQYGISLQSLMCIKWGWRYIWVRLSVAMLIAIIFIKGMDIDSYWFIPAPKSGPFIFLYIFQNSYWRCGIYSDIWNCFSFSRNYDVFFLWAGWWNSSDLDLEGVRFELLPGHRLFWCYPSFLLAFLIKCWVVTSDRSQRFPTRSFPIYRSSTNQPWKAIVKGPLWLFAYRFTFW